MAQWKGKKHSIGKRRKIRVKKDKRKKGYLTIENVAFLLKDIKRAYPLLFAFIVVQCIFSVIGPVLGIYFPKVAVELAGQKAGLREIIVRLGGLGACMAFAMALSNMASQGKYIMLNDMRTYYYKKLFVTSLHCDYAQIESVEGQRKFTRAATAADSGDASGVMVMCEALISTFVNVAGFLICSAIISRLSVIAIMLLTALSLVNYFAVRYAQGYEYRQEDELAGIRNKLSYVEWTAKDVAIGKDIRLYGMKGWFLRLRDDILNTYAALRTKVENRYFMVGGVNAATLLIRDGIAYAYLIGSVVQGAITVGDFVLYFGAVTGFSDFVGKIIKSVNDLHEANLHMNDIRTFLDIESENEPKNPERVLQGESIEIDFEHVTFSYDKQAEPVLKDFSLHIGREEKIALVGVNGAGKTTVVKLLCGFYRPDEGRILINGTDVREYQRQDLLTLFSAVFQDIFIPPFTVAENVSMRLEEETDMDRVICCLQEAGLYEQICEYPDGIHSPMTKAVEDGIVLSGGQQQKLLMARALYKEAPVLILDEPTAALDAVAESETYENFHLCAKHKSAVYISHRLASTRFCDKIVFLKDGRIAEQGTHEELLALGKEYAKMYEIQSQYYQEQKGGDLHG